ncbi:unnamed protein product [Callosobruchus maculatus]|uniref:C2H2-type domain-containing protein n=1 Tax=Callosobruchus maculatus TaxID=64391 RepID=A0A653D7C3_CALMS|nr:unnamed protein product [Callosobruchus maculatus]
MHLSQFTTHEQLHGYPTRYKKKVIIPNHRLTLTQKSFVVSAVKYYNHLPDETINLPFNKFKTTTKKILMSISPYCDEEYFNVDIVNYISDAKKKADEKEKQVNRKSEEEYICFNCNYTFMRKCDLIHHITGNCSLRMGAKTESASNILPTVTCMHCNSTFKTETIRDDHIIKQHPDFVASVRRKKYGCPRCMYRTIYKNRFNQHMRTHRGGRIFTCKHCTSTFKWKLSLDDHIARQHPEFIDSIKNRRIYECSHCMYKTACKIRINGHMTIHCNEQKFFRCNNCDVAFKNKQYLDDHVIQKHPDFIASVTTKIYECSYCAFKTTVKMRLYKHISDHSVGEQTQITCSYCDAAFKRKKSLYDHILKRHPYFSTSVSSKIYECAHCEYKTVKTHEFFQHNKKHPGASSNINLFNCSHCNAKFRYKKSFDNHILKKHPEFIPNVTTKIHKCVFCTYQTVNKDIADAKKKAVEKEKQVNRTSAEEYICFDCNTTFLRKCDLIHHITGNCSLRMGASSILPPITCLHCNSIFKTKRMRDDHIIRQHPEFVTSVRRKIYGCPRCTYRTIYKDRFNQHMWAHYSDRLIKCQHCTSTFTSKFASDDHIVRQHPVFIDSINRKIYKCSYCMYKTASTSRMNDHIMIHSKKDCNRKAGQFFRCNNCDVGFKKKPYLDDHVIQKHPDFIASVTTKIHECSYCAYKTSVKTADAKKKAVEKEKQVNRTSAEEYICFDCNTTFLRKCDLIHHITGNCSLRMGASSILPPITCLHCNSIFKTKRMRDDHIIKQHPEFVTSLRRKIYGCPRCTYRTIYKDRFNQHMWAHYSDRLIKCQHCTSTFTSKFASDDHIVRQHPVFIDSINRKIYKCSYCMYKTASNSRMNDHIMIHSKKDCNRKTGQFFRCNNCDVGFKKKPYLDDHVIQKHPDFIASVTTKIHECSYCAYKTSVKTADVKKKAVQKEKQANEKSAEEYICFNCNSTFLRKCDLIHHITGNCSLRMGAKTENATSILPAVTCLHCSSTFKTKRMRDDHIIKQHPEFVTSVRRKIYGCPICTYRTIYMDRFNQHRWTHSSVRLIKCQHCTSTFTKKFALDDHIVRQHPEFIDSINRKIHECSYCMYKTASNSKMNDHIKIHSKKDSKKDKTEQFFRCNNCDIGFKNKQYLDDHVIQKHPDFIASVTTKIHECSYCAYKTSVKTYLNRHMSIHCDAAITCNYCDATFKRKCSLNDHIVKKHPYFSTSVTSKIYKCSQCEFKTVKQQHLSKHILKHPVGSSNVKPLNCSHCNVEFKLKKSLDNHILRKHPELIASVTTKIHKCVSCTYQTVRKDLLNKHMSTHYKSFTDAISLI